MKSLIRLIILLVILAIAAIVIWFSYLYFSSENASSSAAPASTGATSTAQAATSSEDIAISAVVTNFGQAEQNVSLLAPDASTTIASDYGSYIAPALLSKWKADPTSAPGRVVSSPWPDHIVVNSITPTSAGYEVNGTLVLMTSDNLEHDGSFGTDPLVIEVGSQGGRWLITSYTDENEGSTTPGT